jgi:hypothetical protein
MTLSDASVKALSYVGSVRPGVKAIAREVVQAAQDAGYQLKVVWGFNPASRPEHSAGTALDFMCTTEAGNFIADYLWRNRARLGLRWEIWRRRVRSTSPGKPGTWQSMADRGSVTANHYDHVHANFWDRAYVAPAGTNPSPTPAPNKPTPSPYHVINTVSVSHLKAARYADPQKDGTPRGIYASEVYTMETALAKTDWLKWKYVDGHYGTSTVGDGSAGFGGTTGFQRKHSGAKNPDGWLGKRELRLLFQKARMAVQVID